ncbi:MAG: helix-turn-helix transcriptional regulator [Allorhizobium sp.]
MVIHGNAGSANTVAEVISEVVGFKTQFDVFRFMKRLTVEYRSGVFMVLNLPSATSRDIASNSIITNWPADLLTGFDQGGLLPDSPILSKLRLSAAPFTYDLEHVLQQRDPRSMALSRDLFQRFSLPRGAYFPVHDAEGNRGAVSFSGNREPFTAVEMMELSYVSLHVYNRLAEIRDLDNRSTAMLTDREIDCLNWTAAGKTSVEIAEILSLSEHTINHYLNRATKKLDTVNRTQAVAKALRLGLIK